LGYNRTTKHYIPFKLIYSEEVSDRKQARIREKFFKSAAGKAKLRLFS
jgi:putative endonuclease